MNHLNRREFLHQSLFSSAVACATAGGWIGLEGAELSKRRMTIDLVCGNLGVSANQREAIELAARDGFESVGADAGYLASLSAGEATELKDLMQSKGLVFGAAGLPVEFRQDEHKFEESMKDLPRIGAGLQRSGVERIATWLTPCDGKLTYMRNFRQHIARLRQVANVLKDNHVRLGLEYVGPKTSWTSGRYCFIHTMGEMRDLIAEIGTGNVGLLLDSWHWWHAGDTVEDILALKGSDVIAVDLNDAPVGVPKDQMPDNHRELPCATGVIDLGRFLSALNQIGYDGPVRAEPFNKVVNQMPKEEACEAAAKSLHKAFSLIG
jgi:sugar phosphate isomerase/epimerase